MKVKTVCEFLGIPKGTIGVVTTKEGEPLENKDPLARAMWIKFDCNDMPVGIPETFTNFISYIDG